MQISMDFSPNSIKLRLFLIQTIKIVIDIVVVVVVDYKDIVCNR